MRRLGWWLGRALYASAEPAPPKAFDPMGKLLFFRNAYSALREEANRVVIRQDEFCAKLQTAIDSKNRRAVIEAFLELKQSVGRSSEPAKTSVAGCRHIVLQVLRQLKVQAC
jgi:hypothetical protein